MFNFLKTTITSSGAPGKTAAPAETRETVTRNEIAALFASELASSARRT